MPRSKVLALTRYDSQGASSRVRMLQYIPYLKEYGIEVEAAPLLSNRYVNNLYKGRRPDFLNIAAGYFRRLVKLLEAKQFETLWVEKELLPWVPYAFERFLRRNGPRLVVDYDDAIWLRYNGESNPVTRKLLDSKIAAVMCAADLVTAGNTWLQEQVRAAGARDAVLLPSVVDLNRYSKFSDETRNGVFTIGWIGSPSTVHYLQRVARSLARLAENRSIRLICVGVKNVKMKGVDIECHDWSEGSEAAEVQHFDAGIMPLPDGQWERGKCGYKLIQYMASGVPAVGSAVGANCEIIDNGKDGFLAQTEDDWIELLESLMDDRELCMTVSVAARQKIEKLYSVQSRVEQMATLLR